MNTNETIMIEFIKEQDARALTKEWVFWAFELLSDANLRGVLINPEWLRAEFHFRGPVLNDDEPAMIYE